MSNSESAGGGKSAGGHRAQKDAAERKRAQETKGKHRKAQENARRQRAQQSPAGRESAKQNIRAQARERKQDARGAQASSQALVLFDFAAAFQDALSRFSIGKSKR